MLFTKKKKLLEPLEVKQAILADIEKAICPMGNRQRNFPHKYIEIQFCETDEILKGKFRVAFIDDKALEKMIHVHLQPPRCNEAKPFVKITFADVPDESSDGKGFKLIFSDEEPSKKFDANAYLEIIEGVANVKKMRLVHQKTYVGRCEEIRKRNNEVIRKNDFYFLDEREISGEVSADLQANKRINTSVSRIHAHIEFDETTSNYYLFDDGSSKGTTILHGGRGIAESIDRNAGKILQDNDVINFGKAKVRFLLMKKDSIKTVKH